MNSWPWFISWNCITSLFKTQRLENRHTLFSNTYPSRPASRPNKLVPTLPTLVLINNAYIFCNKPYFVTAMTRWTLPSTVLNMASEKKKRAPKSVCYRFHRETETDYAPTLCVQLRISRELHVGRLKKKEPDGVRFNIRGFFFSWLFRVTRQSCVPTKGWMIAQRAAFNKTQFNI